MRVLILRPEPGASATARAVAWAGHEAIVTPLFTMRPIAWTLPPGRFDAIAMTSANAARLGGEGLRALAHLPVFAVGAATADAARAAGFVDVTPGDAGVDDLARLVPAHVRMLHLCGTRRRTLPIPGVTEVAVYTAQPLPVDGSVLSQADVALVHAGSAGRRLGELVSSHSRKHVAIVAISACAAAACGPGWRSVRVAERPREDAMLALLPALL